MGFTKLDERIVQSSIMMESPETFKVWITLLALCKEDGIAECSPVYLESVCRIPIDKILEAIKRLSGPDELSRSINDNGSRIRRVDGGFEIINYKKYREESLRSAEAERKRLYRERSKCPDTSGRCPDSSASASASFEVEINSYIEYPEEMRKKFISYWTEPNKSKTKLRFQLEKTWDTKRRLETWASRDKNFNTSSAQHTVTPNAFIPNSLRPLSRDF